MFIAVEPFGVKDLLSECSVEAFVITVLPWAAWINFPQLNQQFKGFIEPQFKSEFDKGVMTVIAIKYSS
tara:strand:- start:454 stop:660 length:207 start_codon:yes stop_codon:yes gene_type:complete